MRFGCWVSVLCLCGSTVNAAVYKWTDENGQVHFGDQPPPQKQSQSIDLPESSSSATPDSSDRLEKQQKVLESLTKSRKLREEKAAKKLAAKKKRQADCNKLKARIKHSETVNIYYRYKANGEIEYLSDKQGDEIRTRLKRKYQKECA